MYSLESITGSFAFNKTGNTLGKLTVGGTTVAEITDAARPIVLAKNGISGIEVGSEAIEVVFIITPSKAYSVTASTDIKMCASDIILKFSEKTE